DDQSDSLPPTAALDQSSDNQGPQGEAFGFGHSEGRSASAEDQNSNFDGPPGQALEHALETGRGNRGDDNAGQSATHEATNGHHHSEGTNASADESGPQSLEHVGQFVPPGQAGRGSQQDDSAGASPSHGAANGHDHAGGTDTSADGSGPQSVELVSQFVPPGQAGRGSQQDDSAGASPSHGAANGHDHGGGTDTSTDGSGPQSVELANQFVPPGQGGPGRQQDNTARAST